MTKKIYRGQWAGCSDLKERIHILRENHNSNELKELLDRLDEGYKPKRVRIHHTEPSKPRLVITVVFGKETKVTVEDFNQHYKPCGFQIIREVY